ncbi:unnamed protein product, partial [Meganyctiphanes norvegica]
PSNPQATFKFSFDVKTSAYEGIIFYCANKNHKEFISIFMKDHLLVFSYNLGSGVVVMRSTQPVNDDEWHSVIAQRQNEMGVLYIDGLQESNGSNSKFDHYKHIDLRPPYYVGGLPQIVTEMSHSNTEDINLSLSGCIKDMQLNDLKLDGEHKYINVQKCSEKVEP